MAVSFIVGGILSTLALGLAWILAIMSVSTFITAVILYMYWLSLSQTYFCRSLFCTFSFGHWHCVVCSPSMYGFWLPPLVSSNSYYKISKWNCCKNTNSLIFVYFVGQGDKTKCFWCSGMLSEWEPNDIPIVEHAKFFSQCQWLIASKGKEFVERIQQVWWICVYRWYLTCLYAKM